MAGIDDVLAQFDFSTIYDVAGLSSIAQIVTPEQRQAAVYVLHFADGTYYAGKTQHIVNRFTQHVACQGNIERISIKWMPRTRLADYERLVTQTIKEVGLPVQDVVFVSDPQTTAAFDELMPPQEQRKWLANLAYRHPGERWPGDAALRERHAWRYVKFEQLPYAQEIIDVLRDYVPMGIPAYLSGEYSYWAISCLPDSDNRKIRLYARLNINCKEVFAVGSDAIKTGPLLLDKVDDWVNARRQQPIYWLQLARSPLTAAYGSDLGYLRVQGQLSEQDGAEQIGLRVRRTAAVQALLREEAVQRAIRQLNLALMRQGTCDSSLSHCLELTDQILN
ncbi:hypothetical protein ACFLYO_03515 [Chloroflexota bacterium]